MSPSLAIFGAGPGLGQAVAHRYAREGYEIVLVGRRPEPLKDLATRLANSGAVAYPVVADLADTESVPRIAAQIRTAVGPLDAFYYASQPGGQNAGFTAASALTPEPVRNSMPLAVYTLIALVQEFLPHMLEQGEGGILAAVGAAALQGRPGMSGPGLALAAQRNYLQSLQAEVADRGVYVGRLYIAAAIENTPFYLQREAAKAAGASVPDFPNVHPDKLAELLWSMHSTKAHNEASYPAQPIAP
ncbi:SDR family NAD(P)-dependent oxidoreductase [Microbacterium elymi]|uniref:SDR family NAD(P)-dependent oxidoreductase n=1 Tax=Microbacterium elymi TaxID=2909587 RepID=A0ABY5NJS5_9MICO|nr:SDR family NAD(P)-dependent oxidoreductase [Microbacterium elymi]UUT35417.1 SDR family NAD(P)-dependent oxidoreductase [Microbacterium elymi]